MLTLGQKEYLSKLSPDRANLPVIIKPYDPQTKIIAGNITKLIKEKIFDADIRFMGASALGISGQNDIDIYILCSDEAKEEYTLKLSGVFGNILKNKWHWLKDGYEVSVCIKDPKDKKFKEQLDIFEAFKNNNILKEYENLKISMNGKSYQEYQKAKYEFYNRILNINE